MNRISDLSIHQLGGATVVHRNIPSAIYNLTTRVEGGWLSSQGPVLSDVLLVDHYLLVEPEPETVTIDKAAFEILFEHAAAYHNGDDVELEDEAEAAFAAGRKVLGRGEFAPPAPIPTVADLRDQLVNIETVSPKIISREGITLVGGILDRLDHLEGVIDNHLDGN